MICSKSGRRPGAGAMVPSRGARSRLWPSCSSSTKNCTGSSTVTPSGVERHRHLDDLVDAHLHVRRAGRLRSPSCSSSHCCSGRPGLVDAHLVAGRLDEADAQRIEVGQRRPAGRIAVDADQQRGPGRSRSTTSLSGPVRRHRHRAALVLAGVVAGADPLEEGLPAVDLHVQEAARRGVVDALAAAADRPGQLRRRRVAQQAGRRSAGACETGSRTGRPGRWSDRRRTTRTSRCPRRCRSPPRPFGRIAGLESRGTAPLLALLPASAADARGSGAGRPRPCCPPRGRSRWRSCG